jgi:predicted nucleic acid-binding protein
VIDWAAEIERISVSVITIEEIMFGLAWKPSERIQRWLESFFAEACDVVPVTSEIARRSGFIRGQLRTAGITQSQADSLIAATAQVHDLTLVTRNVRDFSRCPIDVLNPFT